MKLNEKCKELGISLKEGKEKFGLTHWNQDVPEEEALSVKVIEVVKEAVVEVVEVVVESIVDIVSQEDKVRSVRGLGTKSPYWSELNG